MGMVDLVVWHWMRFLNQVLAYWTYLLGIATFIACQYLGFRLFRRLMKQWVILRGLLASITAVLVWMTGAGIIDMASDSLKRVSAEVRSAQPVSLQDLADKVKPAVVTILTYDDKGEPLALGSGFFTSPMGHVITNRHVLKNASRAIVETSNGTRYEVRRMLAEDKKADLVHVAVDSSMADCLDIHPLLRVAKTLPEAGDRVLVVGNPEGLERTVSEGIVSAVRSFRDYGNVIQISAPVSAGSSGSPVLNLRGEVVGVATFVEKEGQNLNFAVSAERFDRMRQLVGESLAVWTECNLKDQDGVKTELAKLGEYRKALEFYEAATKRTPDNSILWFRLGYCHNQLGHHGAAVEAHQKAISLDPQGERLHYHLGLAYFNLTKYREAANAYREEIRHHPKDFEARTELCGSYSRLGLYEEGVKACQGALKVKSDFDKARYNLGGAYLKLGKKELAMDQYWELRNRDEDLARQLIHRILPGHSDEDDLMNPVIRRQN
jgi:serine protease Do